MFADVWVGRETEGGGSGREGPYRQGIRYPRERPITNWATFHSLAILVQER